MTTKVMEEVQTKMIMSTYIYSLTSLRTVVQCPGSNVATIISVLYIEVINLTSGSITYFRGKTINKT